MSELTFDIPELLARVDNDREFLRELLALFKSECPHLVQSLKQAVAVQDMERIHVISHSLKGMLANVTAMRAAMAASSLEEIGLIGDTSKLEDAFAAFESEISDLSPTLDAYLRDTTP